MFNPNSMIFTSIGADHSVKNIPFVDIMKDYDPVNPKPIFVLSFHSYFRSFDYSPVEHLEIVRGMGKALRFTFTNFAGANRVLEVSPDQRIYSRDRGFVEALRFGSMDVAIDSTGSLCKMVNRENLGFEERAMAVASVSHNHSLFVDDILVKG